MKIFGNDTNGGWYNDTANILYSTRSWFIRGGNYGNGSGAGLFSFNSYDGLASRNYSTRAVLVANE